MNRAFFWLAFALRDARLSFEGPDVHEAASLQRARGQVICPTFSLTRPSRHKKTDIRKYIQAAQLGGAFRSIDPAVAARAFVGIGYWHQCRLAPYSRTMSEAVNRQIADRFVEIFLNGVRDSGLTTSRCLRRVKAVF